MAKECRSFLEKAVAAAGAKIPASVARALATGVAQDAEVVEPEVPNLELPVPAALALAGAVPDRVAPVVTLAPTSAKTLAFRLKRQKMKAAR